MVHGRNPDDPLRIPHWGGFPPRATCEASKDGASFHFTSLEADQGATGNVAMSSFFTSMDKNSNTWILMGLFHTWYLFSGCIYIIYNDDIITLVLGVVTPYFIPFRAVSWATTGEGQEFQVRHFSQRGFTQWRNCRWTDCRHEHHTSATHFLKVKRRVYKTIPICTV